MKQEETITINGTEYPVVFNLQTILNYEEIAGKTFFAEDFSKMKDRIALIMSSVLSVDKDTTLTVDAIMQADSFAVVQEIIKAYTVVMDMASRFFKVPSVEPKDENHTAEGEESDDKPKN